MRRWILLLVLVAGSCAPTPESAAAAYDRAVTDLEHGALRPARDLGRRGSEPAGAGARRGTGASVPDAEILIARGMPPSSWPLVAVDETSSR
jgi:hypothetical protein